MVKHLTSVDFRFLGALLLLTLNQLRCDGRG